MHSSAQRVCRLCPVGNVGDEQHLVLSLSIAHSHRHTQWLIGDYADGALTMIQLNWQYGTLALLQVIIGYMDAHGGPDPQSQASDQPQVACSRRNAERLFLCTLLMQL